MTVFNVVINVALVVTTLVVIWYAKETVKESRKATKAAQDTVSCRRSCNSALAMIT